MIIMNQKLTDSSDELVGGKINLNIEGRKKKGYGTLLPHNNVEQ